MDGRRRTVKTNHLTLVGVVLAMGVAPSAGGAQDYAAKSRRVDSLFSRYTHETPGVAVRVLHNGRVVHRGDYGLANVEHGIPISANTVFDLASESKQFTGMAIAMLAEQGRIDLDADIRTYRPDLPDVGLEALYPRLAPLSGPGMNLINVARQAASRADDETAYRRWSERAYAGLADSARRVALLLAERSTYRDEALRTIRRLLTQPDSALVAHRLLTSTAEDYRRNVAEVRREMLAAMGRGLIAQGRIEAGLDTLRRAAHGVWTPRLFRQIADGHIAAGDTAGATAMRARLVVDPRTPSAEADALALEGRQVVGPAGWDSLTAEARSEMLARYRERSTVRALRTTPRLRTAEGRVVSLLDLTGRQPTVVIFWSRYCGGAIEALPAITEVADRLHRDGTPVVFVVGDEPLSDDLLAYLGKRGWTLPVYEDVDGLTKAAFANFGTPEYFVLDANGRIRFDRADGEAELVAQVWAIGDDIPPR